MKTSAMNITSFELIKILRDKVGEEQAAALTNYVESRVYEEFESRKEGFATKKDIADLKDRMDSHFKWLIGLFIGQMAFIFGLVYFIMTFKK